MKKEIDDDNTLQDNNKPQNHEPLVGFKVITPPGNLWNAWGEYPFDLNSPLLALNQNYVQKPDFQPQSPCLTPGTKKKRGRRPLRPFDPIKKKTEEKDKYWLRAFRSYMKFYFAHIEDSLNEEEKEF